MPEELSPQAENDLHELGWYKVGLSIENVKFIIQETLKYPEDPARIRVLIEQAVKGTVLGTVKVVEEEAEPILVPVGALRARPRRTVWAAPEPPPTLIVAEFNGTTSIAGPDTPNTSDTVFVPNPADGCAYADFWWAADTGIVPNVLSTREE